MPKNLKIGEIAPKFTIESYNAGSISLDQLIGQQKIVLIFGRYFGCPICQLNMKSSLVNMDRITETGAQLIYVNQSSRENAQKFIEANNIQFPVIPSTKDALYAQYGLGKFGLAQMSSIPGKLKDAKAAGIEHGPEKGSETQCPGQFVIDSDGKLIHAQSGWLDIESLLAALK